MGDAQRDWLRWDGEVPAGTPAEWRVLQEAPEVEWRLFRAGLKPAVKLEDRFPAEVAALAEQARRHGWLAAAVAPDGAPTPVERDLAGDAPARAVFLARDSAALNALLDSESRERQGGAGRGGAISRSGRLLGYPDCCADFFAGLPRQDDAEVLRAYHAEHVGAGGPLPALLNVFPPMVSPVTWYPCSFQCAASLEQARRALANESLGDSTWLTALAPALSGLVLAFDRFCFVVLHEPAPDDGGYRFAGVSDALSYTLALRFAESATLRRFRAEVTTPLAAGNRIEFAADKLHLQTPNAVHTASVQPHLRLLFTPTASISA